MAEIDIDLIKGLREQSPKAQRKALERYGNEVFAQVARMLPATEDAEEVYQDVFVKVFRNIGTYDAEKSTLRTWISRIAKYQMIGEIIGGFRSRDRIMLIFDQILQQNKELDKKYQDVIKLAKKLNCPVEEMPNLYKAILKFYTDQNKALNDAFKDSITHGKTTRKLQEYVTKQTEKYIKEMEESLQ